MPQSIGGRDHDSFSILSHLESSLVGGLEHEFYFPPWVGTMIQSGEFIFVRGVETTNQLYYGIGHLLILGDLLSHYIFMISSSLVLNSPWNIWNRTCRMFCGLMFSSPERQVPLILSLWCLDVHQDGSPCCGRRWGQMGHECHEWNFFCICLELFGHIHRIHPMKFGLSTGFHC